MKWFMDAPASEIKWENVKDFFRWAFLNTGVPNTEDDEELEEEEESVSIPAASTRSKVRQRKK